jgi:hypothetical protein
VSLRIRDLPSPNQEERPAGSPIDMLILHYTGMKTGQEAIDRLCDPAARVSAHYVVEEDGAVVRLVPEERRAAHAGVSYWRGHSALNGRSIGIEIVNPGHEWGYPDFPVLQLAAVCDLCLAILSRHPIPARNVVAHSDVAPERSARRIQGKNSIGAAWHRMASGYGRIGCLISAQPASCAMLAVFARCARRWPVSAIAWRRQAGSIRRLPRSSARSSGIGAPKPSPVRRMPARARGWLACFASGRTFRKPQALDKTGPRRARSRSVAAWR